MCLNIVRFWHLVHVARETYEMEEVIAVDAPTPKRRRLTDYFAKLPSNTEAQEFLQCLMSALVQDDKRFSDTRLSHYRLRVTCYVSNYLVLRISGSNFLILFSNNFFRQIFRNNMVYKNFL